MAKPVSDLKKNFDRMIKNGKHVQDTIMKSLDSLSSLSTLDAMIKENTGDDGIEQAQTQRQAFYRHLRDSAKEHSIHLTLGRDLINKLRSVGVIVATPKSISEKIDKLKKKNTPVTAAALNAILSDLQTLNPLTEVNRTSHEEMRKARIDRYNEILALAEQHGISITLPDDQKDFLRSLGVSIPPTYAETLASHGNYYASLLSTAASTIAHQVKTLVDNARTLAQSSAESATTSLVDATKAAQYHASDLVQYVEELTGSIEQVIKDSSNELIYQEERFEGSEESIEKAISGISSAGQGVADAVKESLHYISHWAEQTKDAVTQLALETGLEVGAFILHEVSEITTARDHVMRLFESSDIGMTFQAEDDLLLALSDADENHEPVLVNRNNISTALDHADQNGETYAIIRLENADGTEASYTLTSDILRQLIAGEPMPFQSTEYSNALHLIQNAIMSTTQDRAHILFITPEQMNRLMDQTTHRPPQITAGPLAPLQEGMREMPAIIEGPFRRPFVQPIARHIQQERALSPQEMLQNALENRFLPLLTRFVTDLHSANATIGDERIQLLHANLHSVVHSLENSLSLQDTESALDRMIEILDEAETEFQYETGIWRIIQPILNGIAAVAISIAAFCSRPFMEQDDHQAFVEKWSKAYDSTAQRVYKTSQANTGFFSAAEGKDEKDRTEQEHPDALPPRAGGTR